MLSECILYYLEKSAKLVHDWFSQRVTFRKTHRQAQPQPCRHINMYLSTAAVHCIHVLLPHNLDRRVWRDLIIARKELY